MPLRTGNNWGSGHEPQMPPGPHPASVFLTAFIKNLVGEKQFNPLQAAGTVAKVQHTPRKLLP
jgi:hypothetical protein